MVRGPVEKDEEFLIRYATKDGTSLEDAFKKTMKALVAKGHHVILVYPIPEVGVHVPKYIFGLNGGKDVSQINRNFVSLTSSYDVYLERSRSTFALFDSLDLPALHRVYPHTLFCDNQEKEDA